QYAGAGEDERGHRQAAGSPIRSDHQPENARAIVCAAPNTARVSPATVAAIAGSISAAAGARKLLQAAKPTAATPMSSPGTVASFQVATTGVAGFSTSVVSWVASVTSLGSTGSPSAAAAPTTA